jgi:hypothetical protein
MVITQQHESEVIILNDILNTALFYQRSGWLVFPLHTIVNGKCSCGKDCNSPGKHPKITNGVKGASTNQATVVDWFTRWPNSNIGIATGAASGFIVIDIDGPKGMQSLNNLRLSYGELPATVEQKTGSGGRHLLFKYPGPGLKNKVNIAPGIDIRADGGYIVVAPSLHISGSRYEWIMGRMPGEIQLAELPPWWLGFLAGENEKVTPQQSFQIDGGTIPEGSRNETLFKTACSLRTKGLTESAIFAALCEVNNKQCIPPLDSNELRVIFDSAMKYKPGELQIATSAKSDFQSMPTAPEVDETPTPEWPILSPDALHGLAGDIVQAIEPHTESDPVALLSQLLVAFGSAAGRGSCFLAEADRHGLNLFMALVGTSSKGRKGTSWGHIKRLFETVEPTWSNNCVVSGLSSGEGLIEQIKDPTVEVTEEGTFEKDPGVIDKRLLVQEGELALVLRVLQRDGNTLSAILRDAWDGRTLRTLTRTSKGLKATGPHVSIIGHITRDELLKYLNATETANGFANRFLWLCTRRSKCLPEGGNISEVNFLPLINRLKDAVYFARQGRILKRDEAARQLWFRVYPGLSEGKPGLLGAVTARAEAQTMRLATIYSLLDLSEEIKEIHLLAALAFWKYCEDSSKYIFGDKLGDEVAERILTALKSKPEGMTRTEINNLFGGHASKEQITRALTTLQAANLARQEKAKTSGRAIEKWFIT